jgi:trehalose/maltose hydrolase-like predicted phosphorylase/hydroxymethylpyrimidine pyrophosphatase-like HAD family hydrolase
MEDRKRIFPQANSHPFRIIAFDWDGTAVKDRKADAQAVAATIKQLLDLQVIVVVITGTNFDNINSQFASLIHGPSKRNLFICANRGSEVYGFDFFERIDLIYKRKATEDENGLLDRVAEAVKQDIEAHSDVTIDIIYNRLNRRKIDLIPEWPDPEKSQIAALTRATNKRLKDGGFKRGIKGAFELAEQYSRRLGLADARITSDVKHIEVGLTDKADSIRWVINYLAKGRNIAIRDILVLGDEFGPVAGFEGSDYRMVLNEVEGLTYVSVGKEPHGVPRGVIRLGGGPSSFLRTMRQQLELQKRLAPTRDPTFLLIESGFDHMRQHEVESIMAVGSAYLQVRASLEEDGNLCAPATLVAGVYDRPTPNLPEEIVIFPDWLFTTIEVNGRILSLSDDDMIDHKRILDMEKSIYRRIWRHRSSNGDITYIAFLHFVALARPHCMTMQVTVIPENHKARIRVATGLNNPQSPGLAIETRSLPARSDGISLQKGKTIFTDIRMTEAFLSVARQGFIEPRRRTHSRGDMLVDEWEWESEAGQEMNISKFVCIYTSRDGEDLEEASELELRELEKKGVDNLLLEQARAWADRWRDSKVSIFGDAQAQKWANFSAYHLISAGNAHDERVSIAARTLTGPVYKGHVFWDSEIFMLPFFVFTDPPTARAMLMYRYHTLAGARERAKKMGYGGALFAWESTISGEEMTPQAAVSPSGKVIPILSAPLEQHISADVAFGVWFYWNATLDDDFLLNAGAEILVETARFWASRVEKQGDHYYINNVEGPDEYHEGVNNSTYTNTMAAWNLRRAAEALIYIQIFHPGQLGPLRKRLGLDEGETDRWYEIAERIYVDMNREDGLIEQFDGYFKLADIDVHDYEPRTAAIDVILGRERTKATQAIKQADIVLLLYLLEDHFDSERIRKNLLYYDTRTDHGSSLSPAIYGLVAARMGMTTLAMRYLRQVGQIDLGGPSGNAAGGVHAAALGGLYQQLVMGFAGVRAEREGVSFDPKLPSQWRRMEFTIKWRGSRIAVEIRRGRYMKLSLEGSGWVRAGIHGRPLQNLVTGGTYISRWIDGTWQELEEYK